MSVVHFPDFVVTDHGSVVMFEARSVGARAFANEKFSVAGWMGTPTKFAADHRPAQALFDALAMAGFFIKTRRAFA